MRCATTDRAGLPALIQACLKRGLPQSGLAASAASGANIRIMQADRGNTFQELILHPLRLQPLRLRLAIAATVAALVLPLLAPVARADGAPTTVPAPTTAPAPLLDEISRETQNLFQFVRPGLVRVELPPPKWIEVLSDADNPVQKWAGRIDKDVFDKLHDAQIQAAQGHLVRFNAFLATQPATSQPASTPAASTQASSTPPNASEPPRTPNRLTRTFVVARPDGGLEFIASGAQPYDSGVPNITGPRFLGIVLDDAGHLLVPMFIERDALEGRPVHVLSSDGKPMLASFVGSDRQTNLTVLQLQFPLQSPPAKALSLTGTRPPDGSLVMLLSPEGQSGHLSIWTGGQQELGLLIATNGDVGGFVRMGQFLSGDAMQPIVSELIQFGKVRRAALGVLVSQSQTPDGHRAMRIEQVIVHSAAANAGLRQGDFILSLAGSPVGDVPSFAAAIAQRDGQTPLEILRDGQPATVTVVLKPQ
jgi:hypothetical protein